MYANLSRKSTLPNFALVTKLVFISMLVLSFATLASAEDTNMQGQLSHLDAVDRALNHCDIISGVYDYDHHVCIVEYSHTGEVLLRQDED